METSCPVGNRSCLASTARSPCCGARLLKQKLKAAYESRSPTSSTSLSSLVTPRPSVTRSNILPSGDHAGRLSNFDQAVLWQRGRRFGPRPPKASNMLSSASNFNQAAPCIESSPLPSAPSLSTSPPSKKQATSAILKVHQGTRTSREASADVSSVLATPGVVLPRAPGNNSSRQGDGTLEAEEASAAYRALMEKHLNRSASLPASSGAELVDVGCDRKHDTPTLVLTRHGESMWNHLKLFTGDVDIPLTEKGVVEALAGGRSVAEIDFSMIFTSRLMRSKQTALLAMTQNVHKGVPVIVRGGFHGNGKTGDENRLRLRAAAAQSLKQAECRMIPVYADPALNERCYGDLQGLNKEVAEETFGKEVVSKWRRSHDTRPPKGESLKDTWERSMAFFLGTIEPRLEEGKNVLVVSHGNVLRCILSYLCNLKEDEMLRLQIGTALPYAFRYKGSEFEHICVKPVIDPTTGKPLHGQAMGLTSGLKRSAADSLI